MRDVKMERDVNKLASLMIDGYNRQDILRLTSWTVMHYNNVMRKINMGKEGKKINIFEKKLLYKKAEFWIQELSTMQQVHGVKRILDKLTHFYAETNVFTPCGIDKEILLLFNSENYQLINPITEK